ncbi:GGDEF domain-containing protein [Magnetospira sp. QH-2]|uniref:GGDEF domain-containing protein n=1 Tax=Magnetospira sp. (strain QH-2) TaxID=1288970 RepID=UPI0003E81AEB|nr:GGDEF domain-containing protein [Magnetospira sp. QH-2]CCQ74370.1 Putative diguanylate cyclase,containing a GGDEF domain [Magnetospira sp. QH-2]
MAEITAAQGIAATLATDERRRRDPPGNPYGRATAEADLAVPDIDEVRVEASVLGIPAEELTPEVVVAIRKLMEEAETLRRELAATRRHESHLGKLADNHSYLPLYNRRAFLREMSKALVRSEHARVNCTFLYLHLANLQEIRKVHGRAAGDQAMVHAAWILRNDLRDSDLLGSMDGYDFVILLMLTGGQVAEDKARGLVEAVESQPFRWLETHIPLRMKCGLHQFSAGETVDQVIDAAESALRRNELRR